MDSKYILPTSDKLTEHFVNEIANNVVPDAEQKSQVVAKVFSHEELELEVDKAYLKGLSVGKEQGMISGVIQQKNLLVEDRKKNALESARLVSLIDELNDHFVKLRKMSEPKMLAIIFSIVFKILEDSKANRTLITQLLKQHLDNYSKHNHFTVTANSETILEIQTSLSSLSIGEAHYELDDSRKVSCFKLEFDASVVEVDLYQYLNRLIEKFIVKSESVSNQC